MSLLSSPEEAASHCRPATLTTQADPDTAREVPAPPEGAVEPDAERSTESWLERSCRRLVHSRLERLNRGTLVVREGNSVCRFGERRPGPIAEMRVRNPRFWRKAALGGALGAADAYLAGDWESGDLVSVMCVLSQNTDVLTRFDRGAARLARPLRAGWNWLRRNTRAGSRRNIAAHYDLSNDFFRLFLDSTMTYSSGVFLPSTRTLEEASTAKYDLICRKLQLSPSDHLLEIGCGWGGMALHAARHYGCRVTATTISRRQYELAQRRIDDAGLSAKVTLLCEDYRDLRGTYDKLVSIEMIEAVGHRFLDAYFGACSRLLAPHGMMLLQAITIPDHRYDAYRRSADFIQRYVFPGGFLPSFSSIGQSLRRATDFRLFHSEDLAPHYVQTLRCWRERFWRNIDAVRGLGFDDRFVRTWHYYLCYCEAGFRERLIGVSQMLLTKPDCRRGDLLTERLAGEDGLVGG